MALAFSGTAAVSQSVVPVTQVPLVAPASRVEPEAITLSLNKVHLVELPSAIRDVVVANPEIVDVIVKTPMQVYLVARTLGATNIFFISPNGEVLRQIQAAVEFDLVPVRTAVSAVLPNASVELKAVNDSVVLNGTVRSAKESADASSVVRRFVKEDANVVNLLRILEDQQVLLQVRVAEVQRNVLKTLGFDTAFNRVNDGQRLSFLTSGTSVVSTDRVVRGEIRIDDLGLVNGVFSALERQGLVKTLAEPALTAVSGETASFLVGGEVPVPAGIDSNGNTIIKFRDVGVSLNFTPVVLSNNQISIRIATEVARRDPDTRVNIGNAGTAEGFTVRRAGSTVTLPTGGNLMIAGLLQNDEIHNFQGLPGLMHVPVLGQMLRANRFTLFQSELVVLVTAYLVRPVEPKKKLALPTDGFAPATEIDIYLFGRLRHQYSNKALTEVPKVQGPFGYILK